MARTNPEDTMAPSEDELAYAAQNGLPTPEAVVIPGGRNTIESESLPGVFVDQTRFVVLASRLGRMMEPLPKRDPNDDREEIKYAVPEAFERGEIITKDDIWIDPSGKVDNLARLMRSGAIARMDHPDAAGAIEGLRYRRSQEANIMADRGIVTG